MCARGLQMALNARATNRNMNRGWRMVAGGLALLTLAACATEDPRAVLKSHRDVDALENAAKSNNPFNRALQENYLSFAQSEVIAGDDNLDAGYFARKGMRAAKGEKVEPESPAFWPLKASQRRQLEAARANLMTALNNGGRQKEPLSSAKAQVSFDCWIDAASDYTPTPAQCADDFHIAMGGLAPYYKTAEPAVEPEMTAVPAATAPKQPTMPTGDIQRHLYIILFDLNSAALSTDAKSTLSRIATELAGFDRALIRISGHTDKLGSASRNLQLSQQRASMVARTLSESGIPNHLMQIMWEGEDQPAVPTADGVPEQINRRVVLEVTAARR